MKKPFLAAILSLAVFACVRNAPVVPVPTASMASKSGQSLAVLQKGHSVYVSQCGRCHELMMPAQISANDWHIVTPGMAWNAGISKSDEAALLKYILAAK